MLRHVLLLKWVDGVPDGQAEKFVEALQALVPQVPSIRSYACGPDLGLGEGTWDFGLVADFDDVEGWLAYDGHPEHVRIRDDLIRPWVAQRSGVRFTL